MSLGLFNCRLIQAAGDQLFFFALGGYFSFPSLCSQYFISEGRSGVKGARFLRGEANPCTAQFPWISMESEGEEDAEGLGYMRVHP